MTDEKTKDPEAPVLVQPTPDGRLSEEDLSYVSGQLSDEALGGIAGGGDTLGEAFGEAGWRPPGEAI